MEYFKVVDSLNSEVSIDTNETNYTLTLVDKHKHAGFLDFLIYSSHKLELPLDFFFSLNNNIALYGEMYLKYLPKSINRIFEIRILTSNPKHNGIYIKENDLIDIIETLDKIGFKVFQEGVYLWENIYEKVRISNFKDRPSRENSFFLFDNIKDCEYYIAKRKSFGKICKVEIIDTRLLFKADMNLLDKIPNNFTIKEDQKLILKYWSGETSDNIVYEYLFQGKCKLKMLQTSQNSIYDSYCYKSR